MRKKIKDFGIVARIGQNFIILFFPFGGWFSIRIKDGRKKKIVKFKSKDSEIKVKQYNK